MGVFKGLLGDPFIVKLFDFVVSFRWCKPCIDVAGSGGGGAGWPCIDVAGSGGGGAGWISHFQVNYICRGGARLVQNVEHSRKCCVYVVVSIEISAKRQEFVAACENSTAGSKLQKLTVFTFCTTAEQVGGKIVCI